MFVLRCPTWYGVIMAALVVGVASRSAADEPMNACGCRQNSSGACYCQRNAKCGCPGECEPKGCDEKRTKQFENEVELETKRAKESARRQQEATASDARQPKATTPASPAIKSARTHHMTAAQMRELARLLGLYMAEHTASGAETVEALRSQLERSLGAGGR